MKRTFTIFALLVLTSLATGWWLHARYATSGNVQTVEISHDSAELGELHGRIAQLEIELASEKTRRQVLADKLAAQTRAALKPASGDQPAPTEQPIPGNFKSPAHSSIPELDSLTAAGIPAATAEAIRDQVSQNRLAMLRLRDRAQREGWVNSSRYVKELGDLMKLSQDIHDQYGDDVYDRYLYASERANRVSAVAVYPGSSAAASGIQTGDLVLSYAQKNIYAMNDLKNATLEGEAGESVLVVLDRGGSRFSITVPRGPLGIEMRMERIAPE